MIPAELPDRAPRPATATTVREEPPRGRADAGGEGGAPPRGAPSPAALRVTGAVFLLGGCRGAQSALDPRGPQAGELHALTLWMVVGATVVFLAVMAFVVAALIARTPAGADPRDGERRRLRAVAVGTGLTLVILVALLVYSVLVSRTITTPAKDAIPIRVVALQWWWDVTYPMDPPSRSVRTANELHIPVGRPVEITLESRDVVHSFWIPNLHGKMDAIPGRTTRLTLQADEPGVWRGQCAEFCGLQHAKMAFHVIAVPPDEFERWLEEQNRPAATPSDDLARRGLEVFLSSPCATCHTIRGTGAMAAAGPDLTHLASRRSLAAGTLPNRRGALGGWILDPQHTKPGAFMPPTPLDPESLHALLHYLESLK
jgi:cytochrome c oxidase subunit II